MYRALHVVLSVARHKELLIAFCLSLLIVPVAITKQAYPADLRIAKASFSISSAPIWGSPLIRLYLELRGDIEVGDSGKLQITLDKFLGTKQWACAIPASQCNVQLEISLSLDSEGGDFSESIRLANIIAKNKITTFVPPKTKCASSCGFIFLAGQNFSEDEGASKLSRFLYPTSVLRLNLPSSGTLTGASSEEAISIAHSEMAKNIASLILSAQDWNIDAEFMARFLSYTKPSFYDIDVVEKLARSGIGLLIPGYSMRTVTPEMATNYCNNVALGRPTRSGKDAGRTASFPRNRLRISRKNQFDVTLRQTNVFHVSHEGSDAEQTVILVPMHIDADSAGYLHLTLCVVSFINAEKLPGFTACEMSVPLGLRSIPRLNNLFEIAWARYIDRREFSNSVSDCESGEVIAFSSSRTARFDGDVSFEALFVPAETPISEVREMLERLQGNK